MLSAYSISSGGTMKKLLGYCTALLLLAGAYAMISNAAQAAAPLKPKFVGISNALGALCIMDEQGNVYVYTGRNNFGEIREPHWELISSPQSGNTTKRND